MARRSSWPEGIANLIYLVLFSFYFFSPYSFLAFCLRSLCDACGIRYRKTGNAPLGLNKARAENCKRKNSKDCRKLGVSMKMGLMGVEGEISFH